MIKVLKIKANLLPWYNELSDTVETDQKGFPKKALSKIVAFGDCKLDYIDEKEAHFVLLDKLGVSMAIFAKLMYDVVGTGLITAVKPEFGYGNFDD